MKRLHPYLALMLIPLLVFAIGCSKDEVITGPPSGSDEAQLMLNYLESNGDYLNTSAPSIVSAADVRTTQLTAPNTQYLIDMRSVTDFYAGRIEGAVNVPMNDLLNHVKSINAASYDRIVIICYSGQTAGYGAMALRMMGYSNVYSLKWGMSSWDSTFASSAWLSHLANAQAAQFVTTSTPKNDAGSLPVLSTDKTTGAAILEARIQRCLLDGFSTATIDNGTLFSAPDDYYIVNYWSETDYATGHIPGAVQYTPKADLKSSTYLKTLPTSKPIVVYCYTGQTSAFVTMYLRALGYNALTLLYGANAMNYDAMPGTKFTAGEIKGYPYVIG